MISLGRAYRLYGDAKNSLRYLDMAVQADPSKLSGYQLRQLLYTNLGTRCHTCACRMPMHCSDMCLSYQCVFASL